RVREVYLDDDAKEATVVTPDDQLALAIGKEGMNARLAARLTGWKVDITSETDFAQQEDDIEYEGEEAADGRCMAVMTTGRRCPNAALQGSQFCGLPQHQALARFSTNQVAVLTPLSDDEVATLANGEADEGEVKTIVEKAESQFDENAQAEEPEAEEAEEADVPDAGDEAEGAEQNLEPESENETPQGGEAETSEDGGEPEAEEAPAEEAPAEEAPEETVTAGEEQTTE
ncbi:MAG TPA: transcription termination/antitermination protein NusA, partial [Solirubrobacterales bacterium]|nr:transcription termination/antitermination protein NusA [Solirubrobacterales bacterium]